MSRPKKLTASTVRQLVRASSLRVCNNEAGTFEWHELSMPQRRLAATHKLIEPVVTLEEPDATYVDVFDRLTPAGWCVVDAYKLGLGES